MSENKENKIDLKEFQKIIKNKFNDLEILKEALIHRSFFNENQAEKQINNERLEFLGDAVLELVVTEYLFQKYPEEKEGDLTSFRAALVRTESLALEAKKLKLGSFIFMSFGEESTGGRDREYILANAFEALIGAIYKDKGYEVAKVFILEKVCYKTDQIVKDKLYIDAKSRLQSLSQEEVKITPTYELIEATGPDHNKTFLMTAMIGANKFGSGQGKSKQEAEQNAAKDALDHWKKLRKKFFS